jgi:hypothetical protein
MLGLDRAPMPRGTPFQSANQLVVEVAHVQIAGHLALLAIVAHNAAKSRRHVKHKKGLAGKFARALRCLGHFLRSSDDSDKNKNETRLEIGAEPEARTREAGE